MPLLPKRGLVVPKVFTAKLVSPVPKGDTIGLQTIGFCMEPIKSRKSLYHHYFGFEPQENHF